jgi:hypothetical protein
LTQAPGQLSEFVVSRSVSVFPGAGKFRRVVLENRFIIKYKSFKIMSCLEEDFAFKKHEGDVKVLLK